MQNKGPGSNDELLKNLRAMLDQKSEDDRKTPAKKKKIDDYDVSLSSKLSDTMARAMKTTAPASRARSTVKVADEYDASNAQDKKNSKNQEEGHTYVPLSNDISAQAEPQTLINGDDIPSDELHQKIERDETTVVAEKLEAADTDKNASIERIENADSVENVLESVLQELATEPPVEDDVNSLDLSDINETGQSISVDTEAEVSEDISEVLQASQTSNISAVQTDIENDVADFDDNYLLEKTMRDVAPEYYKDRAEGKVTSTANSEKSKRSAAMIADLMDDLGRIENDGDIDEYIASTDNEDDAFAASLTDLSDMASTRRSDTGYDDGIIKRRGFIANDSDIDNMVELPGADTYETTTATKAEPSKVQTPKRQIRRKDGKRLGDREISLAMRFGYEYELAERIGYDRVRDRMQRSESFGSDPSRMKNTFGYCGGEEFSADTDVNNVLSHFGIALKKLRVRTVLTAIIFLLLLAVENISLFGNGKINIPFVEAYPVSVNIVSFVLFLASVLLSVKQLLCGFKDALTFSCSEYSAVSFSVFFVAVYDVVATVMLVLKNEQYFMLNTVTVLTILITLISRCLDYKREYRAFCLVSNGKKKYCAEKYAPIVKNNGRQSENKFQNSFITEKTDIIDGYFERTSRMSEWYRKQSFIIAPIFALALIVFVISYLNGKNLLLSYSYLVAAITLCMPVSMVLFNSVSFAYASKDMNKRGCAVIGEQAADEYSEAYGIVFDEKAMLNASFNGIDRERSCGEADMQKIIKYVCKLVSLIDSSVSEPIISVLAGKDYEDADIRVEHIDADGIEAFSPENHHIFLGEREFMVRNNIDVRPAGIKVNNEDVFRKTLGYLYIAVDDMVCWKFGIDYEIKKDFSGLVDILSAEGLHTGVETVNPNINEDFLLKHRLPSSISTVSSDRFVVNANGASDKVEKADVNGTVCKNSGIIAGRECDVIYPLLWCKRIKRNQYFGMRVTFIMIAVAAVILSLTAVFGLHTSLSSAMLTLLCLILNVPAMLSGLFNSPIPNIDTVGINEEKDPEIKNK